MRYKLLCAKRETRAECITPALRTAGWGVIRTVAASAMRKVVTYATWADAGRIGGSFDRIDPLPPLQQVAQGTSEQDQILFPRQGVFSVFEQGDPHVRAA